MEYHGINMKGKFFAEKVSTKPSDSPTNEARLIYASDEEVLYFGDSSQWVKFYSTPESSLNLAIISAPCLISKS